MEILSLCGMITGSLSLWSSAPEVRYWFGLDLWYILRVPKIFNLRTDPYERADQTSNTYYDRLLDHAFMMVPAQSIVGDFLATFKEFPPRQKSASFTLDRVKEMLLQRIGST